MKVATVVLADNFVTKPKTGVFTVISVQLFVVKFTITYLK